MQNRDQTARARLFTGRNEKPHSIHNDFNTWLAHMHMSSKSLAVAVMSSRDTAEPYLRKGPKVVLKVVVCIIEDLIGPREYTTHSTV